MLFRLRPSVRELSFKTRQRGTVVATLAAFDGEAVDVGLSLPIAEAPRASADAAAVFGPVISRATGLKAEDFVQFAAIEHGEGVIAELAPSVDLQRLQVDTAKLLPELKHHGVLTQVAGPGEGGVRINSRVFVPAVGIPEDPVVSARLARLRAAKPSPRAAAVLRRCD